MIPAPVEVDSNYVRALFTQEMTRLLGVPAEGNCVGPYNTYAEAQAGLDDAMWRQQSDGWTVLLM